MADIDLYTLLFEHFPPTRPPAAPDHPVLLFPEAASSSSSSTPSLSLAELHRRVDVLALGLWSHERLGLASVLQGHHAVDAKQRPSLRAVIAIHTDRSETCAAYATIVLACIKLGFAVVLLDAHRMVQDATYAQNILHTAQAHLLFTDSLSLAHTAYTFNMQCVLVASDRSDTSITTSPVGPWLTLHEANEAAYRQLDSIQGHGPDAERQLLQVARAPMQRFAFLVPQRSSTDVLLSATHTNVVEGILLSHALLQRVVPATPVHQLSGTLTALPLHDVAALTLAIFSPLFVGHHNIITTEKGAGDAVRLMTLHGARHAWLSASSAHALKASMQTTKPTRTAKQEVSTSPLGLAILQPGYDVEQQEALSKALATRYPLVALYNAYAPSSSTGAVFLERTANAFSTTLGYPCMSTSVLIADPVTGTPLPDGEVGALMLRGPTMMPVSHAEVIDEHFLHDTGDVACFTPNEGVQLVQHEVTASSSWQSARPEAPIAPQLARSRQRLDNGDAKGVLTPSSSSIVAITPTPTPTKKPVRDSKRRATHSQIERRRREKINDRLVTLRTIVPACAAEVEERKRIRREEEEEARRVAAGEISATSVRGNGKRKRNRRRAAAAAKKEQEGGGADDDKEEELGLHKLEVLTHTIDYIYELQAIIDELKTGVKTHRKRVEEEEDGDLEADVTATRENEEEDDDDGSEAHLEMAEWKGIAKRRAAPAGIEPISITSMRPAVTRRSTMSSDASSSVQASPALLGKSGAEEPSPMFSATASSSLSNYTALTSPMMSLSAESPILRWSTQKSGGGGSGSGGSNNSSAHGHAAHNSALPSPRSSREADGNGKSFHRSTDGTDWQMLPAPALSMDVDAADTTPTKPGGGGEGSGAPTSQQDEAHLLLALSTSPDVFRPTSAMRHTFMPPQQPQQAKQQKPNEHRRRQSTTTVSPPRQRARAGTLLHVNGSATSAVRSSATIAASLPSVRHLTSSSSSSSTPADPLAFRTKVVGGRSIVLASAPGGAHPSSSAAAQLPSPPLLTLDSDEERGGECSRSK